MTLNDALQNVTYLFLDTAPVIYFVEQHPTYAPLINPIFDRIDQGLLFAVTSPVTLAEFLILPYRKGLTQFQQDFSDVLTTGSCTRFVTINSEIAVKAARLRATYNLTLTDAFQVAVALDAGCQAFLTNDIMLKRVTELSMLVLGELTLA